MATKPRGACKPRGAIRQLSMAVERSSVVQSRGRVPASEGAFENYFELVFENSILGFALVDPSGNFLDANAALAGLLGYPVDHLRTMNLAEVLRDDCPTGCGALLDAAFSSERDSISAECHFRQSNGLLLPARVYLNFIRDREGSAIYGILQVLDTRDRQIFEEDLRRRVNFEELITTLSKNFLSVTPERFDAVLQEALETLGTFLLADRAYVLLPARSNGVLRRTHCWISEAADLPFARSGELELRRVAWIAGRLQRGESIELSPGSPLPASAASESVLFAAEGVASLIWVPLSMSGETGYLCCDSQQRHRLWHRDETQLLTIVAETFASVLERRRIHSELEQQQRFLRQVIDTNPSFIFAKDREGRFTLMNSAVAEAYGTTIDDLQGKTDADFNPNAEEVEHFRRDDLEVIDSGQEKYIAEEQITDASGKVRWLQTVKRPLFDEDGKAFQLLGVATDITERKRVEEELDRERRFIRQVIDLCPSEIYVKDPEGRYVLANDAVAAAYHTTPEELSGKRDADFNRYPEVVARYLAEDQHVLATAQDVLIAEQITRGPDGELSWLQVTKKPICAADGKPTHVLGIGTDISARKQVEIELRESREQYRILAEMCGVGIWRVATTGETVYLNPVMCALLEVDGLAGLAGKTYWEFFRGENIERIRKEEERRRKGEISTYEVDLIGRRGTVRTVMLTGAPVHDAEGVLSGYLATVTDITQQRREAEEQRRLEEKMRQSQKLESLGVLAGGIAHDFNNLLMGILGNAGLALIDLPAQHPSHERVERIRRAARRASDLTNQLLVYSGHSQFLSSQFHLSELVLDMAELLETVVSKRAEICYELSPSLSLMEGDPTQVRQVAMNLITNASDALKGTSGRITVRTGQAESRPRTCSDYYGKIEILDAEHCFLEVEDSGCGMSAETLGRMFDPFFTTKARGHGLGLAAVLGIVRSHQGLIGVRSSEDAGTLFQVCFPVVSSPQEMETVRASKERVHFDFSGYSALVVDDEESVRDVAERMLQRFGFSTLVAESGSDALRLFEENSQSLSLVLLDLTMPDLNGRDVAERLRALNPAISIIFSSGYSEQVAAADVLITNHSRFIQKPYGPQSLLAKIGELLDPKQLQLRTLLDRME